MQVRDHARDISRALYGAACIYIFHPYGHNVIVALIAVIFNLVDLNDYTDKCTLIAFHYNKWKVHDFRIWLQCVCIMPNELF